MLNQVDRVRDEICVHRATGDALNRLSQYYGFDRPLFIKDQYWQKALKNAVYAARGPLGTLFAFLDSLFEEYITYASYDFEVISDQSLKYTGSVNMCNFEGRYVNVRGKRYYITHRAGQFVYLAAHKTTYWAAGDLSDIVGTTVKVQILPYLVEEHGGQVKLIMDAGLFVIPPTYIRNGARQNDPFGGHIMDLFSNNVEERFNSPDAGAYPAYPAYLLADILFSRFFDVVLNILAASIKLTVINTPWCESASLYGSFTHLFRTGNVDPNQGATLPARV